MHSESTGPITGRVDFFEDLDFFLCLSDPEVLTEVEGNTGPVACTTEGSINGQSETGGGT